MTTIYDGLRLEIIGPGTRAERFREKAPEYILTFKVGFAALIVLGILFVYLGLYTAVNYPVIGGFLFLSGVLISLLSREFYVISGNYGKIIDSLLKRVQTVATADGFAKMLFDGTWFASSLLTPLLVRELNKEDDD